MPTFDYKGARDAGYSDQDIANLLQQKKDQGIDLTIDKSAYQAYQSAPIGGPTSKSAQYLANQPDPSQSIGARITHGLVKGIAEPFAQIGTTAYNAGKATGDLVGAGIGKLVGNNNFARKSLDQFDTDLNATRNIPYLGETKPISPINLDVSHPSQVFNKENLKNTARDVGIGLEAGTNLAGFGAGSNVVKDVAEQGLKAVVKPGLKALATQGLKEGLIYGAPGSLGNALQKEGATPGSVATETIFGTAITGLLGVGLGVAGGLADKAYEFLNPENAKKRLADAFGQSLRMTQGQIKSEARYFKDTPTFLAEESVLGKGIPLEGNRGKLDTTAAVSELQTRYQAENAAFENVLKSSGTYDSLETLEQNWVKQAKEQFSGTEQDWAVNKIKQEMAAYRRQYASSIVKDAEGKDIMPTYKFNQLKQDLWARAQSAFNSPRQDILADDLFFQGGHVAKEQIQTSVKDANIQGMNKRLGDFASAIKLLKQRNGAPLGRLNRYMARILGSIIASPGGKFSSFIGAMTGDKLAEILQNPEVSIGIRRSIYQKLQTEGRMSIVDEARQILEQRGIQMQERKLLAAPTTIYGQEWKGGTGLPDTAGLPGGYGMQEKARDMGLPDTFPSVRSSPPTSFKPDINAKGSKILDLRKPAVKEAGAPNVISLKGKAKPMSAIPQKLINEGNKASQLASQKGPVYDPFGIDLNALTKFEESANAPGAQQAAEDAAINSVASEFVSSNKQAYDMLIKFIDPKTGELPEILGNEVRFGKNAQTKTGRSINLFSTNGDDILQSIKSTSSLDLNNEDDAMQFINQYREAKAAQKTTSIFKRSVRKIK